MKIVGERVNLRDRRPEDIDDMRRWLGPGQAWHDWDAPWEPHDWDEARVPTLIERIEKTVAEPDAPRTTLDIETSHGEHIGWVNSYFVAKESNWRDCGILIAGETRWNRGLGREAFTLWVDYLMRAHELPRIGMGTWSGNRRMIRVAARVGMHEEAHFAAAREVRGQRYGAVRWGMTREEWEPHTSDPPAEGLRPFARADWDAAAELIRQLFNYHRQLQRGPEFTAKDARETLFGWRAHRKNRLWVWQEKGQVVGLVHARHDGVYFLEAAVVAEGHRNQGLGARMLQGIENEIRGEGGRDVFLSMVWPGNPRALDFYRRSGYDLINTIELRKGLSEDQRGQMIEFLGRPFHLGRSVPPIGAD